MQRLVSIGNDVGKIVTFNEKNMDNRRLVRSNNSMVAGVCAGIAEYFGWDVTLVRIIYLLASVFTAFAGGIVYVILWLVMPRQY